MNFITSFRNCQQFVNMSLEADWKVDIRRNDLKNTQKKSNQPTKANTFLEQVKIDLKKIKMFTGLLLKWAIYLTMVWYKLCEF